MISLFRNFFQSKIGLPIFIGFLIIVALAFAASDLSGSATFGGLTGDAKVAVVGDEAVTANEMNGAMNNALIRARENDPTITMPQFVERGELESQLDLLIDRYSIGAFAKKYGLRAGDNLVNSEILQINAFQNLTGEFDEATYQAALRNQGISDSILRKDIGDGLLAQQLLRPAFAEPRLPAAAARQYAALVLERRQGQIGLIPSLDYAPKGKPTDAQLNTFYSENNARFILPERRTIRYATFGEADVEGGAAPTDQQIAARFKQDAAQYSAEERRAISSFVVPTEAAAKSLVERIRGGITLEAAAAEAGFQVSSGGLRNQEDMASSTSFALAQEVFAGEKGKIVDPARAALGFYIARIDNVETTPARTLTQVRDDIAAQLQDEASTAALEELSAKIDEQVNTGTSLADVATEFGLELTSVSDVTADGQIYGSIGQAVNPGLRPVLSTAFQMQESSPQLAELVPGRQFLIFDVENIVSSAAPPIAEVRDEVTQAWRFSEGSKAAQKAANRILEAVRGGKQLSAAMADENSKLTEIENIDLERRQLLANPQQRIPAPLVLMFSMAQGSVKLLEDANNIGWYLVDLESIVTGSVDDEPELVEQTRTTLAQALASEYNAQLASAIRSEIGVERNADAIEALRKTLAGES